MGPFGIRHVTAPQGAAHAHYAPPSCPGPVGLLGLQPAQSDPYNEPPDWNPRGRLLHSLARLASRRRMRPLSGPICLQPRAGLTRPLPKAWQDWLGWTPAIRRGSGPCPASPPQWDACHSLRPVRQTMLRGRARQLAGHYALRPARQFATAGRPDSDSPAGAATLPGASSSSSASATPIGSPSPLASAGRPMAAPLPGPAPGA